MNVEDLRVPPELPSRRLSCIDSIHFYSMVVKIYIILKPAHTVSSTSGKCYELKVGSNCNLLHFRLSNKNTHICNPLLRKPYYTPSKSKNLEKERPLLFVSGFCILALSSGLVAVNVVGPSVTNNSIVISGT